MIEEYYEGMNCKCMARSEAECACNWVDWTPKEVYELRKKVTELEQEISDHKANIDHLMNDCHRFTDKRLQERDLEMQAKGIEKALKKLDKPDTPIAPRFILNYDLSNYAEQLRNQAKEQG
jgi:predicted RNase H-like nuclease (RuvC/YqgF family)